MEIIDFFQLLVPLCLLYAIYLMYQNHKLQRKIMEQTSSLIEEQQAYIESMVSKKYSILPVVDETSMVVQEEEKE